MSIAKFAAATAVAALMATGASAATLNLVGASASNTLSGLPQVYDLGTPAGTTSVTWITAVDKNANATWGLTVNSAANVTYTYVGREAGYTNNFLVDGVQKFTTNPQTGPGTTALQVTGGAGLLNFSFTTNDPATAIHNAGGATPTGTSDFAIGYARISDTEWYAFFDDRGNHFDLDDLVVRINVAPVPLPAAGFLLLGGLGVMGAVARRRKSA